MAKQKLLESTSSEREITFHTSQSDVLAAFCPTMGTIAPETKQL